MRRFAIDVLSSMLAITIIAGLIAAFGLTILFAGPQKEALDTAQAQFETGDDRARNYNWPVFRQANSLAKLACAELKELRTCTITSPAYDPMTGAENGAKIRESFACTRWSCMWVP